MKHDQKDFWENEQVIKRRSPAHPVIEAFAIPKVKKIVDVIKQSSGKNYTKGMSLLDAGAGNGYFSFYSWSIHCICLYKILTERNK